MVRGSGWWGPLPLLVISARSFSSPLCLGVTPIPGDQPPGKLVPINTLSGSCSADHSSLPLSSRQSGVLRHKVCNHYNRGKVFSFYLNFKYNPNQEEEMCPALFNDRLSSYWIHKLNCCLTLVLSSEEVFQHPWLSSDQRAVMFARKVMIQ